MDAQAKRDIRRGRKNSVKAAEKSIAVARQKTREMAENKKRIDKLSSDLGSLKMRLKTVKKMENAAANHPQKNPIKNYSNRASLYNKRSSIEEQIKRVEYNLEQAKEQQRLTNEYYTKRNTN